MGLTVSMRSEGSMQDCGLDTEDLKGGVDSDITGTCASGTFAHSRHGYNLRIKYITEV